MESFRQLRKDSFGGSWLCGIAPSAVGDHAEPATAFRLRVACAPSGERGVAPVRRGQAETGRRPPATRLSFPSRHPSRHTSQPSSDTMASPADRHPWLNHSAPIEGDTDPEPFQFSLANRRALVSCRRPLFRFSTLRRSCILTLGCERAPLAPSSATSSGRIPVKDTQSSRATHSMILWPRLIATYSGLPLESRANSLPAKR